MKTTPTASFGQQRPARLLPESGDASCEFTPAHDSELEKRKEPTMVAVQPVAHVERGMGLFSY